MTVATPARRWLYLNPAEGYSLTEAAQRIRLRHGRHCCRVLLEQPR